MADFQVGDWALIPAKWSNYYQAMVPDHSLNGAYIPFKIIRKDFGIIWVDFTLKVNDFSWFSDHNVVFVKNLTDTPCEYCFYFCLQHCLGISDQ